LWICDILVWLRIRILLFWLSRKMFFALLFKGKFSLVFLKRSQNSRIKVKNHFGSESGQFRIQHGFWIKLLWQANKFKFKKNAQLLKNGILENHYNPMIWYFLFFLLFQPKTVKKTLSGKRLQIFWTNWRPTILCQRLLLGKFVKRYVRCHRRSTRMPSRT
jgi:hypothetical protein